jgi:hypothetical protein
MQRGEGQVIVRYVKIGEQLIEDELEVCSFVPVLDGVKKS